MNENTNQNKLVCVVRGVTTDSKNQTITTKELSEILKVGLSTIKRAVEKLSSVLGEVSKNKQGGFIFTQEQATLIKKEIQKHHNLSNRQIDSVLTEKEIIENAMKAFQALDNLRQQKIRELEQKNQQLQIELDESKEWYSIKRMEKLNPEVKFNWRLLKKESEKLGKEIKKVFDQNYGEVNAYHESVFEALYFDTLNFE